VENLQFPVPTMYFFNAPRHGHNRQIVGCK